MKRRLLASILSLVMVLSLLPTAAWAGNEEGDSVSDDGVELYRAPENGESTGEDEDGEDSGSVTLGENIYTPTD